MKEVMGWPVVTAENCFETIREIGIKPWHQKREPMELTTWLEANEIKGDSEAIQEFTRFCPRTDVQFLEGPDGKTHRFFRVNYRPWATVVAFIEHEGSFFVPVTAEYMQGNGLITLVPPSGMPSKTEVVKIDDITARMAAAAQREFREEVGLELSKVVPLGPENGIWDHGRSAVLRYFPFLGVVERGTVRQESRLDENEFLKLVLFELTEWISLLTRTTIPSDFGMDSCAINATFLALHAKGALQLHETMV